MDRVPGKWVILVLCLTFGRSYADRNIVKPSNVSDAATQQALDELDEQTRRAQWKYDQEMIEQSSNVDRAIQFKMMQEEQLRQRLATRKLNTGQPEYLVPSDIEQVIHRLDPDLVISATTNRGVIRYKISLKNWAQRSQIYSALDNIQKLGISSVEDPPSVTVAVDMRSLAALQPTVATVAPPPQTSEPETPQTSDFQIPPLQGDIRDAPVEVAAMPQLKSKWIPVAVLTVTVLILAAAFGVWRLLARQKAQDEVLDYPAGPVNVLKLWVGRSKDSRGG